MDENRQFLTEFFKLWKDIPCLWNKRTIQFDDRTYRKLAMTILVDKFKEIKDDATEEYVKNKMANYKKAYQRALNLIKASGAEGNIYKSTLWYLDLLSFLDDSAVPKPSDVFDNEEFFFPEVKISENLDVDLEETLGETQDSIAGPSQNFDDGDDGGSSFHNESLPNKRKTLKYRLNATKSEKKVFFNSSQKAHKRLRFQKFVIVKKYISDLERMEEYQRIIAEKLISDVMFYGKIGKLSEDSVIKLSQQNVQD